MTKITRITTQRRRKNRYNIFIDEGHGEEYGFSVDEEILIKFNLQKDLELDESMVRKLIEQDSIHESYTRVIKYLGYRARSKKEIRDYLVKREVDHEHINEIMDRLMKEGLIDDREFSDIFVRNRMQMSEKGPGLVKQELMAKGATNKIATEAVASYTYGIQYDKASSLAYKRLKRSSNHSFRKQTEQIQAALIRNGFTQEVIKDVLDEIKDEKESEAEWDALVHHGERLLRRHEQKLTGNELNNKLTEALYRQGFAINLIKQFLDGNKEE